MSLWVTFILGRPDGDGSATTAPTELVDLLLRTERYRVLVQHEGEEQFYGMLRTFESWYGAYSYGVDLMERMEQVEDVRVVAEDGGEVTES